MCLLTVLPKVHPRDTVPNMLLPNGFVDCCILLHSAECIGSLRNQEVVCGNSSNAMLLKLVDPYPSYSFKTKSAILILRRLSLGSMCPTLPYATKLPALPFLLTGFSSVSKDGYQ